MKTFLLDRAGWDLCLDASRNIAVAAEPYAMTQDAASEARVFQGECWYETARGIPYWQRVLGQMPPMALLKQWYVEAVMRVPGVTAAQCFLADLTDDRAVTGQLQITDQTGTTSIVGF